MYDCRSVIEENEELLLNNYLPFPRGGVSLLPSTDRLILQEMGEEFLVVSPVKAEEDGEEYCDGRYG